MSDFSLLRGKEIEGHSSCPEKTYVLFGKYGIVRWQLITGDGVDWGPSGRAVLWGSRGHRAWGFGSIRDALIELQGGLECG